jgi:YidC/Oxa1 family membrane protein insertase
MLDFLRNLLDPLFNLMGGTLSTFHGWGASWWLAIVMLTIIVRTLLFPITYRQVKSMRRMQDLKPDMDRIRAEYKDDVKKQREEMAKLYQERQVNPLGGCLPIFIQLPIFLVLYYTIRHFDTLESFRTGGLLWFQDLTQPDHLFLLPVLYVLTMMASQELTIRNTATQQKQVMRFLPNLRRLPRQIPRRALRLLGNFQPHYLRPELRDLLRPPAQVRGRRRRQILCRGRKEIHHRARETSGSPGPEEERPGTKQKEKEGR